MVFMKAQLQKKVCLLTDCDATCVFLIDHCKAQPNPEPWHKNAVKAAFLKVQMLAEVMEFKKAKSLMLEFCLPTLTKLNHPLFEYRRIYAKLRGAAYFVNESETLFRSLTFDILTEHNLYKTQLKPINPTEPGVDGLVSQLQ